MLLYNGAVFGSLDGERQKQKRKNFGDAYRTGTGTVGCKHSRGSAEEAQHLDAKDHGARYSCS